jgi:hypothetical protein
MEIKIDKKSEINILLFILQYNVYTLNLPYRTIGVAENTLLHR